MPCSERLFWEGSDFESSTLQDHLLVWHSGLEVVNLNLVRCTEGNNAMLWEVVLRRYCFQKRHLAHTTFWSWSCLSESSPLYWKKECNALNGCFERYSKHIALFVALRLERKGLGWSGGTTTPCGTRFCHSLSQRTSYQLQDTQSCGFSRRCLQSTPQQQWWEQWKLPRSKS